ncbi:MAG: thiamine-phosphate kinase [Nitrospirae bacterium GWC2_56_14]|nr:MAG: thiamine-phosphate kinase [Nitrospirae bacterium GWC2_56_14]
MKISDLGEFGLIKKIKEQSKGRSPSTLIGIGDDAAALSLSPSKKLLATTDMLLEGVHFDLSYTDLYSLGWKSAAVNLSDIAAMGGIPRFCLTALGIPSTISVEQIKEFYKGFNALCRKYNVDLVGGDTCRSEKGLVVSVTALGEVEKSKMLTRAGAQPGDLIFVTGTLGDSAAGLELLKAGYRGHGTGGRGKGSKSAIRNPQSEIARLITKHLQPVPRTEWGRKIALSGCATAMIDISDGLSSDLGHICEENRVGAEIRADQIPFSKDIHKAADHLKAIPLHYVLSGGEDYELLFTVPPSKLKKFLSLKISSTQIGTIIAGNKMFLRDDGKRVVLKPKGFNHFARAEYSL